MFCCWLYLFWIASHFLILFLLEIFSRTIVFWHWRGSVSAYLCDNSIKEDVMTNRYIVCRSFLLVYRSCCRNLLNTCVHTHLAMYYSQLEHTIMNYWEEPLMFGLDRCNPSSLWSLACAFTRLDFIPFLSSNFFRPFLLDLSLYFHTFHLWGFSKKYPIHTLWFSTICRLRVFTYVF